MALLCIVLTAGCAARASMAATTDVEEPGAPVAATTHVEEPGAQPTIVPPPISRTTRAGGSARLLEKSDPALRQLLAATTAGTPAAFRRVAAEYARRGIVDMAHQYLDYAREIDPDDPATLDAAARVWRDSGFPQFGLTDAYRAVYFAPASPVARNTLGTLLQAMGHLDEARTEYERAVALDPRATYALNNLCYTWILSWETARAVSACTRALAIDPGMTPARNNLGLAYAMAGKPQASRAALFEAADRATALYNAGIVHLARREYRSAVSAFAAAHALRPANTAAAARAKQAATLAARAEE